MMSNYLTITNYMTNLIKKRLKSDVKSYKKNHYGKKGSRVVYAW